MSFSGHKSCTGRDRDRPFLAATSGFSRSGYACRPAIAVLSRSLSCPQAGFRSAISKVRQAETGSRPPGTGSLTVPFPCCRTPVASGSAALPAFFAAFSACKRPVHSSVSLSFAKRPLPGFFSGYLRFLAGCRISPPGSGTVFLLSPERPLCGQPAVRKTDRAREKGKDRRKDSAKQMRRSVPVSLFAGSGKWPVAARPAHL